MNRLNYSFLLLLLVSVFSFSALNAQDECNLAPPSEVTFLEVGPDYFHAVWPATGISVYQVSVIDITDYSILHQEEVYGEEFIFSGIPITGTTYMAISSLCDNWLPGDPGFVGVQSTTNPIGTSDVVMQIGSDNGENGSPNAEPRVLVCLNGTYPIINDQAPGIPDIDLSFEPSAILTVDYTDTRGNSLGAGQLIFNNTGRVDMSTSSTLIRIGQNFHLNDASQTKFFDYTFQSSTSSFDLTFNVNSNSNVPTLHSTGITANIRYCPISRKMNRKSTSSFQADFGSGQEIALNSGKEEQPTQTRSLLAFPNPARSYVQVIKPTNGSLFVRNAYGQVVYQNNATDQQITIQTNNWPAGMYLIESQQNGQRQVTRLIKE